MRETPLQFEEMTRGKKIVFCSRNNLMINIDMWLIVDYVDEEGNIFFTKKSKNAEHLHSGEQFIAGGIYDGKTTNNCWFILDSPTTERVILDNFNAFIPHINRILKNGNYNKINKDGTICVKKAG